QRHQRECVRQVAQGRFAVQTLCVAKEDGGSTPALVGARESLRRLAEFPLRGQSICEGFYQVQHGRPSNRSRGAQSRLRRSQSSRRRARISWGPCPFALTPP